MTGPYGSAGGRGTDGKGKYPEPEGWAKDGFWRDPSIDSDYETGLTGAVRPAASDRGKSDAGYSYWSDGKGWENSPGSGGTSGSESAGAGGAHSTRMESNATRADYGARPARTARAPTARGPPTAPTAPTRRPSTARRCRAHDHVRHRAGSGRVPGRQARSRTWPSRDQGRRSRGPRRSRPRGGKVKGSWWRRWTWKKALAVVGGTFAVFLLLVVGAYYYRTTAPRSRRRKSRTSRSRTRPCTTATARR